MWSGKSQEEQRGTAFSHLYPQRTFFHLLSSIIILKSPTARHSLTSVENYEEKWKGKGKKSCWTEEGYSGGERKDKWLSEYSSLQTNLVAVIVSAAGVITYTEPPVCWSTARPGHLSELTLNSQWPSHWPCAASYSWITPGRTNHYRQPGSC